MCVFTAILQHSKKLVSMGGDVSQRTLCFASNYGRMLYINKKNNETNATMNRIKENAKRKTTLWHNTDTCKREDPIIRIALKSQNSKPVMSLQDDLTPRYPDMNIKCLTKADNKLYYISIFSHVIESIIDITIPIKHVCGV